ncbi:membrane protein insertase YidC [Sphingomonas sp. LaA6.9]|uniref:membrane protein insertase YidC n=1 Tax=Sphingomonas sp. LaA6.9 TaxID=2919914 RepID=UPI001F503F34|nr:membrane protein insertase YidC [Sphingomonas sp. LaA6.9]MCJ8157466.1 membrane protein insertase YidC [Sphingomonas sp. LaA6.9]
MDNNRNMVLAIVLSALVLFGWTFVSDRYFPTANPPATKVVDGKQVPVPSATGSPVPQGPAALRERAAVLAEAPRVKIETPALKGSINLKGARIDDLTLTRYRETIAKNSPPIRLLSPAGAKESYLAGFGWTGQGLVAPTADTVWTASAPALTPESPVTLSWDNAQGQRFDINLSVDKDYMFTVRQTVTNTGAGAVAAQPFGFVSRQGVFKDPDSWTIHIGPMGVFNGAANYDINFSNVDEAGNNGVKNASKGGWLGFTDKYWLTALVPDQAANINGTFRVGSDKNYQADFTGEPQIVQPGKALSTTSRFFAGAKEVSVLDRYEDDLGIRQFDRGIDWGWFYWFEKPIFYLLDWLFRVFGNFGVAIIGLTLIIRLLMFPIAQKQFKSMAGMRVVQPKMKALQERYKDDKPRLQQEMLKLYQQEKINPLAGCLPILLQIPIFYALYKVLLLTIEMRHQPFALWIKDLSAPDPMTPVNLFGLLPFTPPSMIALGVLPILLGISMWLQFKLNPAPADPVQQQVFGIMPWVFMFIMAPFAAGLQLYWLTNNILSIGQQKWLYSRHPALSQAEAK